MCILYVCIRCRCVRPGQGSIASLHSTILTATILLTEVGEPPDVAQPHTEAQHGEEELDWTVPGDPGLPWLHLHY